MLHGAFAGGAAKPDAPVIGTAVAGNGQVTVTFTPPAYDGGDAIASYTATASPGGATASGAGSPLTIAGLTNGTPYTVTVTATNSAGTSAASSASNSATPFSSSTPGTPAISSVTRGNGKVTVAFTTPSDGGAAIDYYQVQMSDGTTKTGSSSPIVVTGLTNGVAVTARVRAHNTNGYGSLSAASASVTPATVPGVPTLVSAAATGQTTARVTFSAPTDDGGDAITQYTATSTPGSITKTGSASPLNVTGLSPGTPYTFKVKATNSVGTGASSAATNSVTTDPAVTAATVSATDINVDLAVAPPGSSTYASGTSHATVSNGVGPFTYSWAFVSGGAGITLQNATTATVTAKTTNPGFQNKSGTLRCTVTDTGNGNVTCYDDVAVSLIVESNI